MKTDIIDEMYEEFSFLVNELIDALQNQDSYFMVNVDLDEEDADNIAAVASASLGDPVYPLVAGNPPNELYISYGTLAYTTDSNGNWVPQKGPEKPYRINCPIVLACATEIEDVWYFWIEKEDK